MFLRSNLQIYLLNRSSMLLNLDKGSGINKHFYLEMEALLREIVTKMKVVGPGRGWK
jgi:hypothetical protein